MERLPSLLRSTIENACEQFRNITFTVHGESDRARISIIFANEDTNKSKRKSISTVNRDKKRMKEYNNSVETISNIENHIEMIHSDCVFESNKIQDETVAANTSDIMDIEDNPSEASVIACSGNIETGIERPTIELSAIDTEFPPLSKVNYRDILSATSQRDKLVENNDKSKQTFPSNIATDIKLIPKFVLKQSGGRNELLIGKTLRNRLILYHIDEKEFEILDCSDRGFYKFNKVLTEDFRDVRTIPKLMTDDVRKGLDEMIEFATNKKL
ncbi:Hypothetical predicted protein [Mytilus galloprovincialis]|uniref:Uncharacterized protein n=1 Tax=Mytilus galloprovincialis TaxID=29158 RepID=A0A8B6GC09_MYTGA|nr:Hypothetical predicted protein [Mytilus galloprovincialis]